MGMAVLPYRIARAVAAALPARQAIAFGERLADWQFRLSAADRAAVQANLGVVLGHPVDSRSADVREVFRHFGRYLTEFLLVDRWRPSELRVDGTEPLLAAIRAHQSVIVLSAHLGNWEVGGVAIARLGVPVSEVALTHRDAAVDRLFTRQRERAGIEVIPLNAHATRRCLARLQDGGVLCLLGDRDFTGPGLPVDCCGRTLHVARGPALLSLRTGAPLLPVFCVREQPRHLRFDMEPAIRPPAAVVDAQDGIRELMQQYAVVLDRYLRRFPHQWLMFQPRFGVHERVDVPAVRDHPGL